MTQRADAMCSPEGLANIGKVVAFLREWDRGDRTVRCRMLKSFLAQNSGKMFYELELDFAQVASLFLARLTTWMRLTYRFEASLALQLKAVGIFLSTVAYDQYLNEFLEDGGVLILLEILSQSQIKEEEKLDALRLLLTVSNAGRSYKEVICENHGVKVVAECLAKSSADEMQEAAQKLLESLYHGNTKYQSQLYKGLIALLTCSAPKVQQRVLHTLHTVQSRMNTAHHSIVETVLNTLGSIYLEVQDEARNLILVLKDHDVRPVLLSGLVALLRPAGEVQRHQNLEGARLESETVEATGSLPVFVQQAAAAKTIHLLAKDNQEISQELLSLGVIQHLLHAMGNREHIDAQVQASLALKHFVHSNTSLEEPVLKVMGSTLFAAFMNKPDTLYMNMDDTQAELLLTNKVKISDGADKFVLTVLNI
ncbi:armadillo-like helical domain containing protein 1 [Nelusetta ayraudi]|uniref:armadillo-like helical domain containing protein 1 n=1 Tax=Nelusetta ayraudi TaxID=303726 RepID=UPI003F6E990F